MHYLDSLLLLGREGGPPVVDLLDIPRRIRLGHAVRKNRLARLLCPLQKVFNDLVRQAQRVDDRGGLAHDQFPLKRLVDFLFWNSVVGNEHPSSSADVAALGIRAPLEVLGLPGHRVGRVGRCQEVVSGPFELLVHVADVVHKRPARPSLGFSAYAEELVGEQTL